MALKAGQIVKIKRGSLVTSTNPSRRKYVTARVQHVKVHRVCEYRPEFHGGRTPAICWAGTGGYWCETNVENVVSNEGSNKLTIHYDGRDGGWWKVMRDGNCIDDFRDRTDAVKFVGYLNKQEA